MAGQQKGEKLDKYDEEADAMDLEQAAEDLRFTVMQESSLRCSRFNGHMTTLLISMVEVHQRIV